MFFRFPWSRTNDLLLSLLMQGQDIMSVISDLRDEVANTKSLDESILKTFIGVAAKYEEAAANNDMDAVRSLTAELKSNNSSFAAAIMANTPADPAAVPAPAPAPDAPAPAADPAAPAASTTDPAAAPTA